MLKSPSLHEFVYGYSLADSFGPVEECVASFEQFYSLYLSRVLTNSMANNTALQTNSEDWPESDTEKSKKMREPIARTISLTGGWQLAVSFTSSLATS